MGLVVLEAASPSVQRFYIEGVLYTDHHGKALNTWDPDRSFLMIGSWSVPESRIYKGVDTADTSWSRLTTTRSGPGPLEDAAAHDLQVILMRSIDPRGLASIHKALKLMGIVWQDETLVNFGTDSARKGFEQRHFATYRKEIHTILPDLPMLVKSPSLAVHL